MAELPLALRRLWKSPGFTATAVLSIALGIGANTAVFALFNAFLLRPLPVGSPDELVLLRAVHGPQGRVSLRSEGPGSIDPATGRLSGTPLSLLIFERLREARGPLADVFAYAPFSQVHVLVDGVPETSVSAQMVSGGYYTGLRVPARLGRVIAEADDRRAAPPVAVISHRYWQRRFEGNPAAVGSAIHVNTVPTTIVGVSPPGFDGAMQAGGTADISVPLSHHLLFEPGRPDRAEPYFWWVRVMGRLGPGVEAVQARAALEPVLQAAAREGWLAGAAINQGAPMPDLPTLALDPGGRGENEVRRQHARALHVMMGLVGLVAAAACANVAMLFLARGDGRRREIAVRLAIGARARHIALPLLLESLVVACAGALLGVVLAWWGRDLLLALRPFGSTRVVLDLPLDGRVLVFTAAVALATALLAGLAPALRGRRVELTAAFQGGARTVAGRSRLAQSIMVAQVALSMVLLVGTGLFARTLSSLKGVDAGFDHRNLLLFRLDATAAGYSLEEASAMYERVHGRLARLPGVTAATFSRVPLLSRTRQNMTFTIPGSPPVEGTPMAANTNGVASDFFATMQIPILAGRDFTERDDEGSLAVAIVNEAFVRTYLAGEHPVGRHLHFTAPQFSRQVEVVGLARDAKYTDLRSAVPPTVYFPAGQQQGGTASFSVRTAADPAGMFAGIRRAVGEVNPELPVLDLRTQAEQIDRLHGQERLFAWLSGFFGVAALLLACVGLYGLLSQAVLRRTGEIGIRMALGARPAQMIVMVVRQSISVVALGWAVGVAAAYGCVSLVSAMLFGVSPADPLTYGTMTAILACAAVLSAAVPAHRASRIHPLEACNCGSRH